MNLAGTATVTVPAAEYDALVERVNALSGTVEILCAYMIKRRELSVVEFGFIEDVRGLQRTKPSRHK